MKTRLLKLIFLIIFLNFFYGCCDECNYISVSIDKNNFEKNIEHDICNSKEALIGIQSFYDTNKGEATLHIPIPKGHSFRKTKQTKNQIYFITSGENFTDNYDVYIVKVNGLETKEGATLTVELEITYTGKDMCGVSSTSEKKKKSEVEGVPPQ